jgi:flagellar biosynthetic protein FliR
LGLVMGLAMLMLATALQAAGRIVGQMSGSSLAEAVDPDLGAASPLYGRMYDLVSIAAFLLIGGHRQVIAALLDTFQWMPPGEVGFSGGPLATLNEIASQSFVLAVRAAAPVVIALLLSTLVLGLISRTAPQLNILAVGFNLNALVTIAVLALTLGGAAWVFQQHIDTAVQSLQSSFVALLESRPSTP